MIKIRGLVIPDEDKKYVSELSKANPFIYENIDFRDRIPLSSILQVILVLTSCSYLVRISIRNHILIKYLNGQKENR